MSLGILLILVVVAILVAGGMRAAPDLSAADIIKYADYVAQEYAAICPINDSMYVVRDLNDANQARVPVIVKRTAVEVAAGSSRITGTSTLEKAVTLTQNPALEVGDNITWEAQKKLPWKVMQPYAVRLAADLMDAFVKRYVSYIAGNVPTANVYTGTYAATDPGLALSVRDGIINSATVLDNSNIPRAPGRRFGLLYPTLFNALWTLPEVVARYFGGSGNVARFGGDGNGLARIEYADFTIFSATASFATNLTGLGGASTPSKFKNNLLDRDGGVGGNQSVYGVFWDSQSLAVGYATNGPSHIETMDPWYEKQIKSWVLNHAMIWDITSMQQDGSSKGLGFAVLQDDGV